MEQLQLWPKALFSSSMSSFLETKLVADGGMDQLGSIVAQETSGQTAHQAQRGRGLAVADIHDTSRKGYEEFSHTM